MERLIPADTVDAEGTVWETTGENIRNGAKNFSERDARMLVDILYPVGSFYLGDNEFITSVGEWEKLAGGITWALTLANESITGETLSSRFVSPEQQEFYPSIGVRIWKRVS